MFSDEQKDILIGSMLGDGHLQLNANNRSVNARLVIRRSAKDAAYLLWEHKIFEEFCSSHAVSKYVYYNKTTSKNYYGISLTTRATPLFTEYHQLWYSDIKRVPRNLELNTLIMLIWFLDDGCVTRSHNGKGKLEIKFSTEGFVREDSLFLIDLLQYRYSQKYYICDNGTGKFNIRGYGSSADAIIDDISSVYPMDLMGRKATWLLPYEPVIHSYDIKRQKIMEFISDKDIFYSNELGRFAGFTFQRKSRKVGIEIAIDNLMNYLNPYISDGLVVEVAKDNFRLGRKFSITDLGKTVFRRSSL